MLSGSQREEKISKNKDHPRKIKWVKRIEKWPLNLNIWRPLVNVMVKVPVEYEGGSQ